MSRVYSRGSGARPRGDQAERLPDNDERRGVSLDNEHKPPHISQGEFHRGHGVLTDIHERKEAEDRVLQEKTFATTIIDTLPGIFFILAGDGTLVRWKGRVNGDDAFGYTPEEVRAMSALEMVDPRDRELAAAKIAEAFSTGQAAPRSPSCAKTVTAGFFLVVSRL